MGRDGWTGLVVLATSLALFWATLGLERHPLVPVGPGFYPRLVLGVTAALAALLVAADLWRHRRARRAPAASATPMAEGTEAARPAYGLVAIAFAIFGLYVLALPWLGFRIATFAFVVALQAALEPPRGAKGWAAALALAFAATLVTWLAFERYLHVLLPRGRWTDF